MLGRKRSSIFPVPCRPALAAPDYSTACAINAGILQVKLSKQSWGLVPKIRELDDWLRQTRDRRWRESHPELALQALNDGHALAYGKKTPDGREERLALLRRLFAPADALFANARAAHARNQAADDDIIDALALAVTAWLSREALASVPETVECDETGLPMEIVFAPPAAKPIR